MKIMYENFSVATRLILKECESRGIDIQVLYNNKIVELICGSHREILYAQVSSKTSSPALLACVNKEITKHFLSKSTISVAKGKSFRADQLDEAVKYYKNNLSTPIVIKPSNGKWGQGVYTNINDKKQLEKYWKILVNNSVHKILLEEQFPTNKEYRLLATREKFLAATIRIPANIVGDGQKTVQKLIDQKNSDPGRSENSHDPVVKIKIDDVVENTLREQGLTLDSILNKDQQVFLRHNSNLSTGGDSIDTTDIVHESVKKIAVAVVNAIPGLAYAGVDFMCKDVTKEQKPKDYIIVEVNSSPGIDMHHYPYSGKPRNVAKGIVDVIFPETKTN